MMTFADLMLFVLLIEVAKIVQLGFLAIVLCSIWPRATWRHIESEETGDIDQRRESVGLNAGDHETDRATVVARCYSPNHEKAK